MEEIYELLHTLGIKRTYQGYHHLATAILLVIENEERLLFIHKWLYEDVAHIHHTTSFCVERNIRTVRTHFWNTGNHHLLSDIAGCEITALPSNSEFIDILSCHIKKQMQMKS